MNIPTDVNVNINHNDKESKKHLIEQIRDWMVPISAIGSLIAIIYGGFFTLGEYRVKLKEESRLAEAQKILIEVQSTNIHAKTIESNIKLLDKIEHHFKIMNDGDKYYFTQQVIAVQSAISLAEEYEIARRPVINGLMELTKMRYYKKHILPYLEKIKDK